MRILKVYLLILVVLSSTCLYGQRAVKRANNFRSYKDPSNEFGYALNAAYLKNENRLAPQLNFHYNRMITYFFSLGISSNSIYDLHNHNSLALEIGFRYIPEVYFALKPGVQFSKIDQELLVDYNFGIEAAYEYKLGQNLHVGPVAGLNFLSTDVVYTLGFHMGFLF
jgi:hypothetical protein